MLERGLQLFCHGHLVGGESIPRNMKFIDVLRTRDKWHSDTHMRLGMEWSKRPDHIKMTPEEFRVFAALAQAAFEDYNARDYGTGDGLATAVRYDDGTQDIDVPVEGGHVRMQLTCGNWTETTRDDTTDLLLSTKAAKPDPVLAHRSFARFATDMAIMPVGTRYVEGTVVPYDAAVANVVQAVLPAPTILSADTAICPQCRRMVASRVLRAEYNPMTPLQRQGRVQRSLTNVFASLCSGSLCSAADSAGTLVLDAKCPSCKALLGSDPWKRAVFEISAAHGKTGMGHIDVGGKYLIRLPTMEQMNPGKYLVYDAKDVDGSHESIAGRARARAVKIIELGKYDPEKGLARLGGNIFVQYEDDDDDLIDIEEVKVPKVPETSQTRMWEIRSKDQPVIFRAWECKAADGAEDKALHVEIADVVSSPALVACGADPKCLTYIATGISSGAGIDETRRTQAPRSSYTVREERVSIFEKQTKVFAAVEMPVEFAGEGVVLLPDTVKESCPAVVHAIRPHSASLEAVSLMAHMSTTTEPMRYRKAEATGYRAEAGVLLPEANRVLKSTADYPWPFRITGTRRDAPDAAAAAPPLPPIITLLMGVCPKPSEWQGGAPPNPPDPEKWHELEGSDMDFSEHNISDSAVAERLRAYAAKNTKDFGVLWRAFGKTKQQSSSRKADLFYGSAPEKPTSIGSARKYLRQVVPGVAQAAQVPEQKVNSTYGACHGAAKALCTLLTDVADHYTGYGMSGWPHMRFAGLPPPAWALDTPPPENMYYVIFARHPSRHATAGEKGKMAGDMDKHSSTWAIVHAMDYMDKSKGGQAKKSGVPVDSPDAWALHKMQRADRMVWTTTPMQIRKNEDPHLLQFTGYRGTGQKRKPAHGAMLPLAYHSDSNGQALVDGNFSAAGDRDRRVAAFNKAMDKMHDELIKAGTTACFMPMFVRAGAKPVELVVHPWYKIRGTEDCFM